MGQEDALNLLLPVWDREVRRRTRRIRLFNSGFFACIAVIFAVLLYSSIDNRFWKQIDRVMLFTNPLLWLGVAIMNPLFYGVSRLQANTIRFLADSTDRRALGPLIEALELRQWEGRDIVLDAIPRLLALMGAVDIRSLSEGQRAALRRVLSRLPSWGPNIGTGRFGLRLYQGFLNEFSDKEANAFVALLEFLNIASHDDWKPIASKIAQREATTVNQKRVAEAALRALSHLNQQTVEIRLHG